MGFYGVQMHPLGLLFPFKIWVQEVLWVITDPGLILIGWLILLPSTPLSLPPPPFLLPSLSLLALAVKNNVLAFSIPGILIEILSALGNSLFVFCLFLPRTHRTFHPSGSPQLAHCSGGIYMP